MSNPTVTDPIPVKFTCRQCNNIQGFWAVTPDSLYKEPSREEKGNMPKMITMSQCPLCSAMNTVYWYTAKTS